MEPVSLLVFSWTVFSVFLLIYTKYRAALIFFSWSGSNAVFVFSGTCYFDHSTGCIIYSESLSKQENYSDYYLCKPFNISAYNWNNTYVNTISVFASDEKEVKISNWDFYMFLERLIHQLILQRCHQFVCCFISFQFLQQSSM